MMRRNPSLRHSMLARSLVSSPRLVRACSLRARRASVQCTMGFEKELLAAGSGAKPTRGQTVTVHCTGYGKNRDMAVPFWRCAWLREAA